MTITNISTWPEGNKPGQLVIDGQTCKWWPNDDIPANLQVGMAGNAVIKPKTTNRNGRTYTDQILYGFTLTGETPQTPSGGPQRGNTADEDRSLSIQGQVCAKAACEAFAHDDFGGNMVTKSDSILALAGRLFDFIEGCKGSD